MTVITEVHGTALQLLISAFKIPGWQIHLRFYGPGANRIPADQIALTEEALKWLEFQDWFERTSYPDHIYKLTYKGKSELERLGLIQNNELTVKGIAVFELATLLAQSINAPPNITPVERLELLREQIESIVQRFQSEEGFVIDQSSIQWEIPNSSLDFETMTRIIGRNMDNLLTEFAKKLGLGEENDSADNTNNVSRLGAVSININNMHGVLNAGNMSDIEQITVHSNSINQTAPELAQLLRELTEIVTSSNFTDVVRTEAIERVAELTVDIDKPISDRKKWKLTGAIPALTALLNAEAATCNNWDKIQAFLHQIQTYIQGLF